MNCHPSLRKGTEQKPQVLPLAGEVATLAEANHEEWSAYLLLPGLMGKILWRGLSALGEAIQIRAP
jgi:hypothetical protein